MENTDISTNDNAIIIGYRIRLPWVGEVIIGAVLIGLCIFLCYYFPNLSVVWLILSALFFVLLVIDLITVISNNCKGGKYISYKNGVFRFYNGNVTNVNAEHIHKLSYKKKTYYFITPFYWRWGEYNCGKLILIEKKGKFFSRKYVFENVHEPDRVVEKMYGLLHWNIDPNFKD